MANGDKPSPNLGKTWDERECIMDIYAEAVARYVDEVVELLHDDDELMDARTQEEL